MRQNKLDTAIYSLSVPHSAIESHPPKPRTIGKDITGTPRLWRFPLPPKRALQSAGCYPRRNRHYEDDPDILIVSSDCNRYTSDCNVNQEACVRQLKPPSYPTFVVILGGFLEQVRVERTIDSFIATIENLKRFDATFRSVLQSDIDFSRPRDFFSARGRRRAPENDRVSQLRDNGGSKGEFLPECFAVHEVLH